MQVVSRMNGMGCRLLRRHGFFRLPKRPIFVRHTVGTGGIYVDLSTETIRMTVMDTRRVLVLSGIAELRKEIERLDEIEWIESVRWKERISQFSQENEEELE